MTAATTFLLVIVPFVVLAALAWTSHLSGFRAFGSDGPDARRVSHELDAIRTHLRP